MSEQDQKAPTTVKGVAKLVEQLQAEIVTLKETTANLVQTAVENVPAPAVEAPVNLRLKVLDKKLTPVRAHEGDAGMDVFVRCWCDPANITQERTDDIKMNTGARVLVKTGVFADIPKGYEIQVRPRSGLALWEGITIVNSPGTVDAGYKGEIGVVLLNTGARPFVLSNAMKIAQLVVSAVPTVNVEYVDSLTESSRGEDGYNSTGV